MRAHWPYYTLRLDGRLYDDRGYLAFPQPRDEVAASLFVGWGVKSAPAFKSVGEAEDWLQAQGLRGNVRDA